MLTLALDTSMRTGSVALGRDGELLIESRLPVHAVRSESVLPEIDRMIRSAGFRPSDIDRIAVGSGPGSFTGVRIAAALAKGVRAATGADLFAYSSLAVIAAGTAATGPVCAAIDARRGQVYAAGYEVDGRLVPLFDPVAAPFDTVLSRLVPADGWTLASAVPGQLLETARSAGVRVLPAEMGEPRAGNLLRLVDDEPDFGYLEDPESWEPEYVRASSAERELRG